jgi:S-adenosylmethionine:tRNA ribosyltransferase-isomerase
MRIRDFDYDLPPEFIAQTPVEPRDSSRLLILHRDTGSLEHRIFRRIGEFLRPGDLLVLNQTRVIPARIYARRPTGGRVELLLLRREDLLTWECLVGGKGLSAGRTVLIEGGPSAQVVEECEGARRRLRFAEPIEPFFPQVGHVPLPPYIHARLADPERYQTVYAREPGSAAAPTAGLHFTPQLLQSLEQLGIELAYLTLHVGLDTFAPVGEEDPTQHTIHTEWCELSPQVARAVNSTTERGGRVIAVGTTSVRTLETAAQKDGRPEGRVVLAPYSGNTSLYITPGFRFRIVDAMVTNFHLPKSTLIMLVSAFAGREKILAAYEVAKRERYRFYSFGDAMLIL